MAKDQIKQKQTPEVIHKLEEAFAIDASVEEACYYADIAESTYYAWCKENEELSERFKRLRNKPILLARQTVNKKISESYSNAMDYLSRKKKLEFSTRTETDLTTNGKDLTTDFSQEEKTQLLSLLNDKGSSN